MNWTRFQTYGMASDKAFETLCNQLFTNWVKDKYSSEIISAKVVNGAGGDGGVESYATLKNGAVIGLQAKWFQTSMGSSQFNQIKNSITTAMKVRPEITRYIVCVPRDLTSKTAKSDNSESAKWDSMLEAVHKDYPALTVDLWDDTYITTEMQKASSAGIHKYWFDNAEISDENIRYAFDKAKESWLSTKYVPDLNVYGSIEKTISLSLGDLSQREKKANIFFKIGKLCEDYYIAADAYLTVCSDNAELVELINQTTECVKYIHDVCKKIAAWYIEETPFDGDIDEVNPYMNFDGAVEGINSYRDSTKHYFHASDVTKILRKLAAFNFDALIDNFKDSCNQESLLILGAPGTGKTHGISAISEKLFADGVHVPLIIPARDIPNTHTWKDIISDYLGLSSTWDEDEIWQALTAHTNRKKFLEPLSTSAVKRTPKVIIFIDGLDESSTHMRWVERIRETGIINKKYPQIRFCFTSRPTVFEREVDYARVIRLNETGDVPTHMLFDHYMCAYNIKARHTGWLKYSLTSPLALKLFCELNENQTISLSSRTEVSMTELWRKKVEKIDREFCEKVGCRPQNQYILKTFAHLAERFIKSSCIEHSTLVAELASSLSTSVENAEEIVTHLDNYGVLHCYCEHGTGISPDKYYYYPGIQGYFDYASAITLLDRYEKPENIDFSEHETMPTNTLNSLAIISIQKYGYLLTRNSSINSVISEWAIHELQFFALLHTDYATAEQFKARSLEIMSECAEGLIKITNHLVLPLARDCEHPLGVKLLDEFLGSFEKPAQRDILWSIPGYLNKSEGKRWDQDGSCEIEDAAYLLESDDTYNGLPVVYAWVLSSVNNNYRKLCRGRLMDWAQKVPEEFYKLFLKFSAVNDPQIISDLFSILMCLVYEGADNKLVKDVSGWILENILHPEKIDNHRDISIRYYCIAIVKRAEMLGILTSADLVHYLPPYTATNNHITLNKDALSGTRMGGYSAINYDLARYVLVDHIENDFHTYPLRSTMQFENLIGKIVEEQPDYEGMTVEQFIISAAYAYILEMGWNERDFYNFDKDESGNGIIGGVDCSIRGTHTPKTHGSQSTYMTVCEKYVWQARNYISGFLCDRLLYGDDKLQITDYGLLDNFVIPVQEYRIIDPDNIPDDRPWHVPEREIVVLEGTPSCADDVIESVRTAPVIDWSKWIFFENTERKYQVDSNELVALNTYSCFYGTAGVETCLFINAILLDQDNVPGFVEAMESECDEHSRHNNPTDWYGVTDSACYVTPKEVCWFSWKTHYESSNADDFPQFKINSAVDECCYNYSEYGDVYFNMPSASLRSILGITDSDGYLFYDKNRKVIAEHSLAGEKWGTYQNYVILDRSLCLEKLKEVGKSLVWIMMEIRRESGNAQEKFGKFGAERIKNYIGYFDGGEFVVKEIKSEFFVNKSE